MPNPRTDPDDDLGRDPHRFRPRQAPKLGRAVSARLNRLAVALNYAHEELSEIRHDLGIADRLEVQRRKIEDPAR